METKQIEIRKAGNRVIVVGTANTFLKSSLVGELSVIPEDFVLTGRMNAEGYFELNKNSQTEIPLETFMRKYLLGSEVITLKAQGGFHGPGSAGYKGPGLYAQGFEPGSEKEAAEAGVKLPGQAGAAAPGAVDPNAAPAGKANRVYLSSLSPELQAQYRTDPPPGIKIQISHRGKEYYEVQSERRLKQNVAPEEKASREIRYEESTAEAQRDARYIAEDAKDPPWMIKYGVQVKEINRDVTRYSRAGFNIDIIENNLTNDYTIRENGKVTREIHGNVDAYKYIASRFKSLSDIIPPKPPPSAPMPNPNAMQQQQQQPMPGAVPGAPQAPVGQPPMQGAGQTPPPLPGSQQQANTKAWPTA